MDLIKTYEPEHAHRTFPLSKKELAERRAEAVMLLRCCADGVDALALHGRTIEHVAMELDLSLFTTLYARLWAHDVMQRRNAMFETEIEVLLEAALVLEDVHGEKTNPVRAIRRRRPRASRRDAAAA